MKLNGIKSFTYKVAEEEEEENMQMLLIIFVLTGEHPGLAHAPSHPLSL